MDTDSIAIKGILPIELIGNQIGQFKLEHEINHAYFISPKLYALETSKGEIIINHLQIFL